MKSTTYITLLLYLLMGTTLKASFFWSAGMGLELHGEREAVLSCARIINELYQTDAGERLVNQLKQSKAKLYCSDEDQQQTDYVLDQLINLSDLNSLDRSNLKAIIMQQYSALHISETSYSNYPFIKLNSPIEVQSDIIKRLDKIQEFPSGKLLFKEMLQCQKELIIQHDKTSISAGGFASAQRSTVDIYHPGRGADAKIRFRFDMPDHGTHLVTAINNQMIPFTALDILFHELVHAKHIMCGTFSRGNAERQAIIEENQFRKERIETQDWPDRNWRAYEEDQQIWFGFY